MESTASAWKRAVGIALAVVLACTYIIVRTYLDIYPSADMTYRSANYEVEVQRNGDLKIREHIDVALKKRGKPWRQLYQQYRLDPDQLTAITGVSVKNTTTGETYTQADPVVPGSQSTSLWDSTYAGHWYIKRAGVSTKTYDPERDKPDASGGYSDQYPTIEIGWNIPATDDTDSMRFDITMTFEGVSTAYDDVATFQWEPIGTRNTVPIGEVTGTVTFPDGVTTKNSATWLHFEGPFSQTTRDKDGTLHFSAKNVESGMYLDVVAMVDIAQMNDVARHEPGEHRESLITSEQDKMDSWARYRDAKHKELVMRAFIIAAIGITLCVAMLACLRGSIRKTSFPKDAAYRREPPDMTPNNAARLNALIEHCPPSQTNARALSATMLSLASKHAIRLLPGTAESYDGIDVSGASDATVLSGVEQTPAVEYHMDRSDGRTSIAVKPDDVTIVIEADGEDSRGRAALHLCDSETDLLDFLEAVGKHGKTRVFDMKQMRSLMNDWKRGAKEQQTMVTQLEGEFSKLNLTVPSGRGGIVVSIIAFIYLVASCALLSSNLFLQLVTILPVALCVGLCMGLMRFSGLNEHGRQLASQLEAFKRYLNDFSDFTDRGTQELALWDKYLVYAAAFGLSEQVMSQLARSVPELSAPQWLDDHASGSLVYWMYRPTILPGGVVAGLTAGGGSGVAAFAPSSFVDLGAQLNYGFVEVQSAVQTTLGSSGSGSSGGFGGGGGGAGGGSFGGR